MNLSLAVSPVNGNFVVGGYETSGRADNHNRFATSTDGGLSWQGGSFNGHYFGTLDASADALVAFDAQGTAYYATSASDSTNYGNAYLVFTSTNGLTWSEPSRIIVSDSNEYHSLADLAIDPRVPGSGQFAGSIYFSSAYQLNVAPYTHGIYVRSSRDGGVTWSPDIQVSDQGNEDSTKSSIKVASDGTVYVGFTEVLSETVTNPPRLFLDRSTDGGQTWGSDHLIAGAPVTPIGQVDAKGHELVMFANAQCAELRINHYPVIGVSPANPDTVYVVWNDGRWEPTVPICDEPQARPSDIAFSRTTDGGVSWSAPIRVNDDPQGNAIDQWQPNMVVAPDGTIGVTWYDRRYSSDHYLYDVAYAQSTDGGLTWTHNQRVTDTSSDAIQLADVKGVGTLGFRTGTVFGSNYVLTGWIDTRDAPRQGHLYVDRGVFSLPTATPFPSATACAISFSDVPQGSTFYPYVRCLACRGIVSGYSDNTFRPGNNVTRGQVAKIVSNSAGFNDPQGTQLFEDVVPGSAFFAYINRLVSRGYMEGYPCGGPGEPCGPSSLPYFRPNNNATRGQIAKIDANAAGYSDPPVGQSFEDVPVGSAFYTYTQRLATRGVMGGYPCGTAPVGACVPPSNLPYFLPNNNATRGQTSKIVANTFFPNCQTPRKNK